MTTPRIYIPGIPEETTVLELDTDNLKYLKTVLRLKIGDPLILFDGTRYEYESVIKDYTATTASVEITGKEPIRLPDVHITLAQSLPKAGKMDLIVQKATELGVTTIIPFTSERSIPKLSGEKMMRRVSRWRKIAIEASRQCRRSSVPEVTDIIPFDAMLERGNTKGLRIIFWEDEFKRGLKDILRDKTWDGVTDYFLVVGPEGGFSWAEVERAHTRKFLSATLGTYILRTETAGLSIISIIQYEKGILGAP